MANLTPPLHAKGLYAVKEPFTVKPAGIYTCVALRKFEDLVESNVDVFNVFYAGNGLERSVYETDLKDGAVIVTLMDQFGQYVFIPDSHILSYPVPGDVEYHHAVLSVSLGPLPKSFPLDHLIDQLKLSASDAIGLEPEVKLHSVPTVGAITYEQHEIMEAARTLRVANRQTAHADLQSAREEIILLNEKVQLLTQLAIDNGILTEE